MKSKRLLLALSFTSSCAVILAQSIDIRPNEQLLSIYAEAKAGLDAGDIVRLNRGLATLELKANSRSAVCLKTTLQGLAAYSQGNTAVATQTLERAVGCLEQHFGKFSLPHCDAYACLSWCYGGESRLDEEQRMNEELIAFYSEDPSAHALDIADCYNTIGINQGMRGDRDSELTYLNKGLRLVNEAIAAGDPQMGRALNLKWNLTNSSMLSALNAGKHHQARLAGRDCIALIERFDPQSPQRAIAEQAIGRAFWYIERDIDSCLHYTNLAIARVDPRGRLHATGHDTAVWMSYTSFRCDLMLQAGQQNEAVRISGEAAKLITDEVFHRPQQRESAMKLLTTAAAAHAKASLLADARRYSARARSKLKLPMNQHDLLLLHWTAAELLIMERAGANSRALALIDSVTAELGLDERSMMHRAPSTYNASYTESMVTFGQLLIRIGEHDPGIALLRRAAALHLKNRSVFFASGTDEPVLTDLGDPVAALIEALATDANPANTSANAAEAAQLLMTSKAVLLQQHRRQEALFESKLPSDLNRSRKELRAKVFSAKSANDGRPSPEQSAALADAQARYEDELNALRQKHPDAFLPESAQAACDPRAIADRENAWVIDYFLTNDALYAAVSGNAGIQLHRREKPEWLTGFLSAQRDPRSSAASNNAERWSALRAMLIDGIVPDDGRPLIIIPHRELHLLNFEALPGSSRGHRFLIQDREVRYAPGLAMLCNPVARGMHQLKAAAFSATDFSNGNSMDAALAALAERGGLFNLNGAAEEAARMAEVLGGVLHEHATVSDFVSKAPGHTLIHIGAHGFAYQDGTDNSYLLFEAEAGKPQRLTRADVAAMDLPADLVVLSACNTGLGAFRGGEGVASMARAFFQAGSKSVVSSLWPLPDARTSEVMSSFYTYMRKGMRRSEALRQAKLDYLDAHPTAEARTSYYWAGLVVYGEDGPLTESSTGKWWAWILGLTMLALSGIAIYRRFRNRSARGSSLRPS